MNDLDLFWSRDITKWSHDLFFCLADALWIIWHFL